MYTYNIIKYIIKYIAVRSFMALVTLTYSNTYSTYGISLNTISFVSFSTNSPGPDIIALIVPDEKAYSFFSINT